MARFRSVVLVPIVAVVAFVAAPAMARAAPVATLRGAISPHGRRSPGAPIRLALDTRLASRPPGGRFVVRRLDYLLPRNVLVNARRFPSCRVRTLQRARGLLRACPRGSRIGRGIVSGRAVDIGVTSRARVTLFNGPGGRSLTMNVAVRTPAIVNATVSAPFRAVGGARKLTIFAPPVLTTILDSPIVTSRVHVTIGATRVVRGVRRSYLEAKRCPRSGRAKLHGAFRFAGGARASADAKVSC